jgi:hypothetical protein
VEEGGRRRGFRAKGVGGKDMFRGRKSCGFGFLPSMRKGRDFGYGGKGFQGGEGVDREIFIFSSL